MKSTFKFFVFVHFCLISNLTFAQLKKVKFEESVKIHPKDITITMEKREEVNRGSFNDVAFKSLEAQTIIALKSGLKAGVLNDRMLPSYIEGKLKNVGKRGSSVEALAQEYLELAAPLMKINNPLDVFVIEHIEKDDLEMTHVKMKQTWQGIPIYGAEIIIHGDERGFDFLNGTYHATLNQTFNAPKLDKDEATHLVYKDLNKVMPDVGLFNEIGDLTPKSQLVVYPKDDLYYLAYHVTAYTSLIERWEYFIDAITGMVIHKFPSLCKFHAHSKHGSCRFNHDILVTKPIEDVGMEVVDGATTAVAQDLFNVNRTINTYEVSNQFYLIDGSRDIFNSSPNRMPNDPNGVIWTIDASNTSPQNDDFKYKHVTTNNNVWNNKTAVSAHYNGGKAFEYFRNVHNRRSINGQGGNIVSIINVADEDGSSMGNAFWNGQAMFYGNGDNAFFPLARGLDVAGHEMSHGVIQSTANLEYEGESGALNESFADVFGVLIDREDWKIGEDVVKIGAFPSGALRNLENPHNGAATNDFNSGYQPKLYSERYLGKEDNGGVHINSGIPNFAFFKFANTVGKDKAEKVYYRALTNYLTKSSQFIDCRVAVIKAASDLFGQAEADAAKKAFSEVGILGESGGNYEADVQTNPGQEFVLTTGENNVGLFLHQANGTLIGQISSTSVLSKPSISDDGSEIIFVGEDNRLYNITIDWSKNPITPVESIIGSNPVFRNAIISKDGLKIAVLTKDLNNKITVFYLGQSPATQATFDLYNPSFSQGISTGDVNYADAMEFDVTSQFIMYDAENEIKSGTTGSIRYFDISFIKVWDTESNTFSLGNVSKLYASLPEDVSIGNPTFSKNSPYIIAFDFIDENDEVSVLAANTEQGNLSLIFENNTLGYPNYSSKDDKLVFDNEGNTSINLGVVALKSNKIEIASDPVIFTGRKRWAVWFSNGKRILSGTEIVEANGFFTLQNNPVQNELILRSNLVHDGNVTIKMFNLYGQMLMEQSTTHLEQQNAFDTSFLNSGTYILQVAYKNQVKNLKFIKQ